MSKYKEKCGCTFDKETDNLTWLCKEHYDNVLNWEWKTFLIRTGKLKSFQRIESIKHDKKNDKILIKLSAI